MAVRGVQVSMNGGEAVWRNLDARWMACVDVDLDVTTFCAE